MALGNLPRRMAREEKPYRVYRGGRAKGKVPTVRPARVRTSDEGKGGGVADYRGPGTSTPKRARWGLRIGLALGAFVLLLIVWAVAGWFSVSSGVSDANKRLTPDAKSALASRAGDMHSDSILLLRTDPSHHRLYYLSIPRDLRVDIPGYGPSKINAAYQIGGPRLAIRTVATYTDIPVNHVVIVNFPQFKELIDKLGGITIDVPRPIVSKFDCPFRSLVRCSRFRGWRFRAGTQHLTGRRALIYSRVRENLLDPSESDITRGERNQQVLQATMSKLASFSTFMRLPLVGGSLVKPLATDLSTNDFMSLGWAKFRAGSTIHCRLGGTSTGSDITPSEDNAKVILMVLGKSAVQPPAPSGDTYPPGCIYGTRTPGAR